MLINRRFLGLVVLLAVLGGITGRAVAAQPGVFWQAASPVDFNTPLAFETASNWMHDTYPAWTDPGTLPYWPGQESNPPGFDSTFTLEGFRVVDSTVEGTGFNGTVLLSAERSGNNGTMKLGAMGFGNNPPGGTETMIQKLIIANSVSFTGLERRTQADGWYNTQLRHIRVGRGRNDGEGGGFSDVHAWGIVQQTAGLVDFQQDETMTAPGNPLPVAPQIGRAELLLSSDKDKSAGSLWEVGGTASLNVPDEIRLGDNEDIIQMSGHAIFRVRGSQTGSISVGNPVNPPDPNPSGDFKVVSRGGMWDVSQPGGSYGTQLQYNLGKSISEFVLDAGGVTPITVADQLVLGGDDLSPGGLFGGFSLYPLSFLRIRLMEPTEAGFVGEDPVVLFNADRIGTDASDGYNPVGTEYDEGRFFDPDHDGPALSGGLTPHARLWNGDTVVSEYAGATYNWTIEYFEPGVAEGDIGGSDDDDIDSYVRLVNGTVTGLPGDVGPSPNSVLDASDIDAIFAAMGTPIELGSKQNKFDLDGDEDIDYFDAIEWVTHTGFANTLFGDLNLDGSAVVQADLDALLGNLGNAGGWAAGDLDGDGQVTEADRDILLANCTGCSLGGLMGDFNGNDEIDAADYTTWRDLKTFGGTLNNDTNGNGIADDADFAYWRAHFGEVLGGGAGSSSAAVPEPASFVLAAMGLLGLMSFRRRRA